MRWKIFNNGLKSEVQANEKNEDDTEKNISGKGVGTKPIDGSVTNEQSEKSDSGYYSAPENNRVLVWGIFHIGWGVTMLNINKDNLTPRIVRFGQINNTY